MFGKKRKTEGELPTPPNATDDGTVEVLRVWAGPDEPQQLTLRPIWQDPGAWGLMLADIARHAAAAYADKGADPDQVLARIRELFEAEWENPTDPLETYKDSDA
ncbi:MAG: DUF5076 domain-containing protein [Planctomycetota bacterium]